MVSKTAHLRELRLAKEVSDKEAAVFDSRFASEGAASNQEVGEQNLPEMTVIERKGAPARRRCREARYY